MEALLGPTITGCPGHPLPAETVRHQGPSLWSHHVLEHGLVPTVALKSWPLQGEKKPGETTHKFMD